jgi:hypothetical protein
MKPLLTSLLLLVSAPLAQAGERVFVPSAKINSDLTVTLPLREGRVGAQVVWYIVTEASTSNAAERFGAARASKLANALKGTDSLQRAHYGTDGLLHFDGTVDFRPERVVVGDPVTGFPPLEVAPGAVADVFYSPLVLLPDGSVINAPHVANDSGRADKVVRMDTAKRKLDFALTEGFSRDNEVLYISTDASDPVAAALENVTFVERLGLAPRAGGDGTDSARASLAAFVNGPTGVDNPERQGLNSALLGEGDPLNLLAWMPNQGRYSPLWDVHLAAWKNPRDARRLEAFDEVEDLAEDGKITAPDGSSFGATGFIVNCPILAELD